MLRNVWATAVIAAALCGFTTNARAQGAGITLHPGLTVNFSIYGGFTPSGVLLGDYDFVNQITEVAGGGYRYDFWFTGSNLYSGSQAVSPEDKKRGITIREFWPGGDQSAKGYVSYLAVSDATYADLKAGKETQLVFDGPENPQSIRKIGEEDLVTLVNERKITVHTIKARGTVGGTFWIVDDPALPMIIKGETKWKWMATSISDSRSAGKQLVSALNQSGEGSTHAILFALNSAEFDRGSKPVLESVLEYLKGNPKIRLEIQGHTDNIGGPQSNLALSQKRAESVKTYFVTAGIDAGRLVAKGYGLSQAVADNATPEGRAQNRRVVFRAL